MINLFNNNNLTVENNDIHGAADDGVTLYRLKYLTFRGNIALCLKGRKLRARSVWLWNRQRLWQLFERALRWS